MNPLKRHLKKSKISQKDFAKKTGLSHSAIHKYISGIRNPGLKAALAIEKETNGEVTILELLGKSPRNSQ